MELGAEGRDRLAQAGAYAPEAGIDGIAIRALEHHRQETLAQLSQVPPGFLSAGVPGRQPQDRRAHDLLCDFGGDDLRDIGDAIDVDDGYGERHLAQRSHGHRLLETAQEAAAVELRPGALIGGIQRILRRRGSGAHDTDRALRTVGAGARLVGASALLEARFRGRARGDRPARELPEQGRHGSRPHGLEPLTGEIPRRPQVGDAVPAATLQHDAIASDEQHEIRQPFDQRIRGLGEVRHADNPRDAGARSPRRTSRGAATCGIRTSLI